jgi:hypothetical protein
MNIRDIKNKSQFFSVAAMSLGALFSASSANAAGQYYTKINAHTYYIYADKGTCISEQDACWKSNFCGTTLYAHEVVFNLIADKLKHNWEVRVSRTSDSQVACTLKN